ncbi:MAG: hypothetical protein QM820_35655 [Minicystis sp.]
MSARAAVFLTVFAPLVFAACGGAIPPPQAPEPAAEKSVGSAKKSLVELRRSFIEGCSAKVSNAPDFCECGWEQMTKTFTEDEMNASGEDREKLQQLQARIAGACKAKLPEAQIKGDFVKSCSSDQAPLAPYCECTYGEYRKTLSIADLVDDATVKTERFAAAKKSAVKACGAKLPEQVARAGFMAGCAKDEAMKGFCDCAWKQLRSEHSAAEIEADLVDLTAARAKIDKGCSKLRPVK